MKAEIISVGTELLLGEVVNTNATYLSAKIAQMGFFCYHHSVVGDNGQRLREQLQQSLERSELILLTGGLGPTYDDITKEVVAEVLGLPLVFDEASAQVIKSVFEKSQQELTDNNYKQAYTIETATILANNNGTAPGLLVKKDGKILILLPGPPKELEPMFEQAVMPILESYSTTKLVAKNLYLTGLGESKIESILKPEMMAGTNPTIAPYAFGDGVVIRVMASGETQKDALALIEPVVSKIKETFSDYIYSIDVPLIEQVVVQLLSENQLKVATAESCTGGLLAQRLTSIPGASHIFDVGVVTYSNQQKIEILDVDPNTLKQYGAVSEEVAKQMALGVLKRSGADFGLAITGVAGPTASEHKAVGLVYIALATAKQVIVRELNLSRGYQNERARIRQASTTATLKMLYDHLKFLNIK